MNSVSPHLNTEVCSPQLQSMQKKKKATLQSGFPQLLQNAQKAGRGSLSKSGQGSNHLERDTVQKNDFEQKLVSVS